MDKPMHPIMMMMQMYFTDSVNVTAVLFKDISVHGATEMGEACVAVLGLALFYEFVKAFRLWMNRTVHRSTRTRIATEVTALTSTPGIAYRQKPPASLRFITHLMQSLLYVIQVTVAYGLMLVVMTYNAWLCIATCAGLGLGYLLFGWVDTVNNVNVDDCCG